MMDGGMMGGGGAWMMAFWIVLTLVFVTLAVVGGVWLSRALSRRDAPREVAVAARPPGLDSAQAELRHRYAAGEISREEYLQGKIDLE